MSFNATIKPAALAVLAALAAAGAAHGAEPTLPQVNVQAQSERADGPLTAIAPSVRHLHQDRYVAQGRPCLGERRPGPVVKDQAMQSMADVIRYVPGAMHHQGEATATSSSCAASAPRRPLRRRHPRRRAGVSRPLHLERVEVLKGAGGMIFGRGAPAASSTA